MHVSPVSLTVIDDGAPLPPVIGLIFTQYSIWDLRYMPNVFILHLAQFEPKLKFSPP